MKLELLRGSRSRILATVILVIMAIFVVRLFYLQVIQHGHYVALAKSEQYERFKIPASRGEIYAMSGDQPVKLVMNESVYTVFIDPVIVSDKEEAVELLKRVAGGNVRPEFEKLFDRTDTRYQIVATKLSRTQADKIKEAGLSGIGFHEVSQRVYPEGSLAAQVLGFVNAEGKGNYGIESGMDEQLRGIDGVLETVTDVSDVPLTIGNNNTKIPAQHGTNLVLTIDRNVQSKAEQALAAGLERTGAEKGSVLIMDPRSGKILAMANAPSYNPAEYYNVEDVATFNNGTISAPYEPGSVIKTFTMATGVDKNVVRPNDTYVNTDVVQVDDARIFNFTRGHTGTITFQTALEWSLNTGFVTIAQRLGDGQSITYGARQTMYHYFHDRFRLGQLTGIELANELPGTIISPDDVQGNAVRYANMSFGQGMDATMLQVAAGFSALINGGTYYKPTVIGGEVVDGAYKPNGAPTPVARDVIKQATSDQVRTMMETARRNAFGQLDKPGYMIGGKTGTAQVSVPGGYSTTETVGTYLGYGGQEMPEYVIMVSVSGKDKELQGARDAMPIFTDISNWMLDYLKIQPKG